MNDQDFLKMYESARDQSNSGVWNCDLVYLQMLGLNEFYLVHRKMYHNLKQTNSKAEKYSENIFRKYIIYNIENWILK